MKIIAISGGIASGKNFIADIFAKYGGEIFDADKLTHHLLIHDLDLIKQIAYHFPNAVNNHQVSRHVLGEIVFNDKNKLKILENIIHPKIRDNYQNFISQKLSNNCKFVILNIPLLLESGGYKYDYLVAIKCQKELRLTRFLLRSLENNLSDKKLSDADIINLKQRFEKIYTLQLSDEERFAKADFIIDNNLDVEAVEKQVRDLVFELLKN